MNGFADAVRSRLAPSCLVDDADSIDKGKCGASLAEAPHPRVIVDLDETGSPLSPTNVKCDFLFFADPGLIVPIEVKDSEPNVTKATKQLQAGAKAAEELAPSGVAVTFRAVLVSKSLRTHKRNELRGAAVKFRNQRERVRRLACGDSLTEAIGSS
ncbi:MAG: hypothetical protein OXC31_01840 [Spirochaetaceae bacterium]|nr:hypothetical protein [Spirochaetaceae bacterium]